jgi:hypothetical protein
MGINELHLHFVVVYGARIKILGVILELGHNKSYQTDIKNYCDNK